MSSLSIKSNEEGAMMKKKTILFTVLATVIAVSLIASVLVIGSKKKSFDQYEKYSLSISVDVKREDGVKPHLIDVSYDGENARVSSSAVNKDSYIIGKRIYYLEDDTFYWYSTMKSYVDIYDAISTFDKLDFVKDVKDGKQYTTILKESTVNDILDSLFIVKDASGPKKANVILREGKVSEFNIVLSDLQEYDEVDINVTVTELQDDYTVNTSRIFGTVGGGRRYKTREAPVNAFRIVE